MEFSQFKRKKKEYKLSSHWLQPEITEMWYTGQKCREGGEGGGGGGGGGGART